MPAFRGFAPGTRYTPLPSPLLGPLLQDVDTLAELKVTFRSAALLHQRRGEHPWLTLKELLDDPVLHGGLVGEKGGSRRAVVKGLQAAVERGVLLAARDGPASARTLLFLNDPQGQVAYQALLERGATPADLEPASESHPPGGDASPVSGTPQGEENIFSLYEANIGVMTPLVAEELKEAETSYPWAWIQEAFQEAVVRNRRSWRYVARILERWATEGKGHGESGRHPEAVDPKEYLRQYGGPPHR